MMSQLSMLDYFQVTATSVVILLYLSLGMVIGFPAILIPAVTNDDNADNLHLTMAQASWCGGYFS